MSAESLPNCCDANENPLRLLGTMRMLVHLGHTRETLKFIVCETLAAGANFGAKSCDQHIKVLRLEQKLVELY